MLKLKRISIFERAGEDDLEVVGVEVLEKAGGGKLEVLGGAGLEPQCSKEQGYEIVSGTVLRPGVLVIGSSVTLGVSVLSGDFLLEVDRVITPCTVWRDVLLGGDCDFTPCTVWEKVLGSVDFGSDDFPLKT